MAGQSRQGRARKDEPGDATDSTADRGRSDSNPGSPAAQQTIDPSQTGNKASKIKEQMVLT